MTDNMVADKAKAEVNKGFGEADLKRNAALYRTNRRLVDAAAKYDNLDEAVQALSDVWAIFEAQIDKGTGYTPDRALGFGSDNAAQIAEKVIGKGTSDAVVRKQLAALGK